MFSDSKDINIIFQINTVIFYQRNMNKCITVSTKILSSTTVFNIDSKMFLEQQTSILEQFVKDHVTLKTGVMMLKI